MDKKKIAFLSRYYGEVDRGVETFVTELSKRLSNKFEVKMLSGKKSDSISSIIGGKFDVVIATNGRMQSLKASVGRIVGGYKLIISGQAGIGKDDIWNIAVARPDIFVALTDLQFDWAKTWSPSQKLIKIPNGVDLEKFNPNGKKIDLKFPSPVVLSVGALFWYKHHELTINAVAQTKNLSLLIIGDGPEKNNLEKLGNKLIGPERFKIMQVSFENIPKYYRSADVFALPSWDREAFGIVYVEAMASGLPVVAPDDKSRREIIGDAGLLVDVNNAEAYASALQKALEINWGIKPVTQASKFSWDKIAAQYEKMIEEM